MKKPNVLKNSKVAILLLSMLSIAVLYHTGVKGEKDCLALGHAKSTCAQLFD